MGPHQHNIMKRRSVSIRRTNLLVYFLDLQLSLMVAKGRENYLVLSFLDGDESPDDSQDGSSQGHPDDTDGTWDTGSVFTKVKLGQQESKSRRLHGSLNGHGTGRDLSESSNLGKEVSDKSSDQVKKDAGNLQRPSGVDDGFGNLGDGTGDQKTGGNHTNNGGEWKDGLDEFGEELVGGHTNGNGSQDNLKQREHMCVSTP